MEVSLRVFALVWLYIMIVDFTWEEKLLKILCQRYKPSESLIEANAQLKKKWKEAPKMKKLIKQHKHLSFKKMFVSLFNLS